MDDTNKDGADVVGPDGAFVAGSTDRGAGGNVAGDCWDVFLDSKEKNNPV